MKLTILTPENKQNGTMDVPSQFSEPVRADLIKKAVESIQSRNRQPYGAKPGAGMRASALISKRRRKYRGSYGFGISRTPRKILSRRGTRMNWAGAVAPNTVGGRRAHPPKAEKLWEKDMNRKERRKAIRSALAATIEKSLVIARGHNAPDQYPFIIDDVFQKFAKTQEVVKALDAVGMQDELLRTSKKSIRAGKGTMRGRKYREKSGVLFVVDDVCNLYNAAQNIPGVEIMTVDMLNAEILAPGGVPGRLTLFTQSALKKMAEQKLFTDAPLIPEAEEDVPKVAEKKPAKPAEKKPSAKKATQLATPKPAEKKPVPVAKSEPKKAGN